MRSCRLITHCYASKLPQYAVFLRYQLMSLARCTDDVQLAVTVCYSTEDQQTVEAIQWFQGLHPEFSLRLLPLDNSRLFRRSIGRNIAALESTEELIWFTDVDNVFLTGCFDGLFQAWDELDLKPAIVFPRNAKIHKNHAAGDRLVAEYDPGNGTEINVEDFIDIYYDRPIGGIQIVAGETARKHGYLNSNKKHQTPVSYKDWRHATFDDVVYREFCAAIDGLRRRRRMIQFPGLYRLRHTKAPE